jgi:hypothetical protein
VRFTIEPLGAGQGRKAFSSGTAPLDRYLHEIATQDIKRRLSNCFIARDKHGKIAGYYTFAASSVPLLELPENETKRLPRYGVLPAGLIGRLAVDQNFRLPTARSLLLSSMPRMNRLSDSIGILAFSPSTAAPSLSTSRLPPSSRLWRRQDRND